LCEWALTVVYDRGCACSIYPDKKNRIIMALFIGSNLKNLI